jgi:hypothetical protein
MPEYVSCDLLAKIGTTPLKKLMGTAGRAENVGCSGNEVVNNLTFLSIISILFYRPTTPSDPREFEAADSEVDRERHAIVQPN